MTKINTKQQKILELEVLNSDSLLMILHLRIKKNNVIGCISNIIQTKKQTIIVKLKLTMHHNDIECFPFIQQPSYHSKHKQTDKKQNKKNSIHRIE